MTTRMMDEVQALYDRTNGMRCRPSCPVWPRPPRTSHAPARTRGDPRGRVEPSGRSGRRDRPRRLRAWRLWVRV